MARFCGGINLGTGLKALKGVICDADASTVNVANAVTGCGQLWDGALFTKAFVDGAPVITLHNSEGDEVGEPVKVRGNCGVGLDGRFFKLVDGAVNLQDGFLLTVNVTPADATIKVTDVDSTEISPVTGKTNVFLLSGLGDTYTVAVSKTGYTAQTKTVTNNGDQTITVTLVASGG